MNTSPMKVVAIDQAPEWRNAYERYFYDFKHYSFRGAFTSVPEALTQFKTIRPQIIISEIDLPMLSGIDGILRFHHRDPEVKVLIISDQNDTLQVRKAFKNGASGYLTKPLAQQRLLNALDILREDGASMSGDIAKKVISLFRRKYYDSFSKRENQIIEYLTQGATYKDIAEKLFVTTSTVNFHIQNIYLKLNVNSKSEALQKLNELECA